MVYCAIGRTVVKCRVRESSLGLTYIGKFLNVVNCQVKEDESGHKYLLIKIQLTSSKTGNSYYESYRHDEFLSGGKFVTQFEFPIHSIAALPSPAKDIILTKGVKCIMDRSATDQLDTGETPCSLCMMKDASCLFSPCGHCCLCSDANCLRNYHQYRQSATSRCFVCRTPIGKLTFSGNIVYPEWFSKIPVSTY